MSQTQEYMYQVFDDKGTMLFGFLSSHSEDDAVAKLTDLGYKTIDLKSVVHEQAKKPLKVASRELLFFYLQLVTLLEVDVPLRDALSKIHSETSSEVLKHVVHTMIDRLEKGFSFYTSFKLFPGVFKSYVSGLVEAGESSGRLHEVFQEIFKKTEKDIHLKQEMLSLLSYPFLLLVSGVLVMCILMLGVYPHFMTIFQEQGLQVPLPTLIIHKISQGMSSYGVWVILPILLGMVMIWHQGKRDPGRLFAYKNLIFKIPWFGQTLLMMHIGQMFSLLHFLMRNGLSLMDAMFLAAKSNSRNPLVILLGSLMYQLKTGSSITQAMKSSDMIPGYIISLVGTAEETGKFEEIFLKIANYLDDYVKLRYRNFMFWLEPFLLTLFGLLAAMIIASVLLPLFNMIRTFRQ